MRLPNHFLAFAIMTACGGTAALDVPDAATGIDAASTVDASDGATTPDDCPEIEPTVDTACSRCESAADGGGCRACRYPDPDAGPNWPYAGYAVCCAGKWYTQRGPSDGLPPLVTCGDAP